MSVWKLRVSALMGDVRTLKEATSVPVHLDSCLHLMEKLVLVIFFIFFVVVACVRKCSLIDWTTFLYPPPSPHNTQQIVILFYSKLCFT